MAKRFDFPMTLGIVSMLVFSFIAVDAFTGIDLSPWLSGLTLIIVGMGLLMVSGIKIVIGALRDGMLSAKELMSITTAILAGFSIILGVLRLPPVGVAFAALQGVAGIVAIVTILFIAAQTFFSR